ncbi:MAG: ribosome maturation factor RimP [Gammaproteobacteria bacterium]|jgi:ribosome maturation factor RimP
MGRRLIFCFRLMYKQNKKLLDLIEPVVSSMGFELLGIEHIKQGRFSLVRLYIDKEVGIELVDCEKVSHQVTGVLDVEDPIQGAFNLEVSSPGLDRLLFTLAQFNQHKGKEVKLNLGIKLDGRRKYQGKIADVGNDYVMIESDGQAINVPAEAIQWARIVPATNDYNIALKKREH